MAFQIIRHAFRMIFGNFGQVARIVVVPLLSALGIAVVIYLLAAIFLNNPDLIGLALLLCMILIVVVTVLVVISWHRFVLLREHDQEPVRFSGKLFLQYIWQLLLFIVLMVVFLAILEIARNWLASVFGYVAWVISSLLTLVFASVLSFRIGLVLPSRAVGKKFGFRASWNITRSMNGSLWRLCIVLVSIDFLLVAIGYAVVLASPYLQIQIVGVLFLSFANIGSLFFKLTVITILYSHLVEKRPLTN